MKLIGRITHFALALSISTGVLNALSYQSTKMLLLVSGMLLIANVGLGFFWEYSAQQYITLKLKYLNWDPKPDFIAFIMSIAGWAGGMFIFWFIYFK